MSLSTELIENIYNLGYFVTVVSSANNLLLIDKYNVKTTSHIDKFCYEETETF